MELHASPDRAARPRQPARSANASNQQHPRPSAEESLALWGEYKRTGNLKLRNRLVMTYAPLVKYIVFKKVRQLPVHCEVDDFISCGLEALMASIDRYEPAKGATLEQFVWTRIHGAVLDELRRLDFAPRSVRRWERDIAKARTQFNGLHGRRPTRDELADSLGITVEDLRRHQDDIALSDVTSLNSLVVTDDDTNVQRIDTLVSDDERMDPERAAAISDDKDKLRLAFRALTAREREVAILLYVKELNLREIGDILGVSESRICQIHTGIKRKLKHQLASDGVTQSALAA